LLEDYFIKNFLMIKFIHLDFIAEGVVKLKPREQTNKVTMAIFDETLALFLPNARR
jgi:hypothetical protein